MLVVFMVFIAIFILSRLLFVPTVLGAFVLNVSHMTYKLVSHREEFLEMIQNIINRDSEND